VLLWSFWFIGLNVLAWFLISAGSSITMKTEIRWVPKTFHQDSGRPELGTHPPFPHSHYLHSRHPATRLGRLACLGRIYSYIPSGGYALGWCQLWCFGEVTFDGLQRRWPDEQPDGY
jgi:hypothetical protein